MKTDVSALVEGFVIPPPVQRRSDLYDDLVRDVAEGIRQLNVIHGLAISEETISDRANNIVQGLVCNYSVRALPPAPTTAQAEARASMMTTYRGRK
jgi:hypothetical protein